jgi:hypothetical protein
MIMRAGQRYLLAAVAFAIATLWTGVGLVAGLECLLVFCLVALGVAGVQRRRDLAARPKRRARRIPREGSTSAWPERPRSLGDEATDDWRRSARSGW